MSGLSADDLPVTVAELFAQGLAAGSLPSGGSDGDVLVKSGTTGVWATPETAVRQLTVADLPTPAYMAHRLGGANVRPDNLLESLNSILDQGHNCCDGGDLQLTSDRTPVSMHDSTVDRTTDGTGAIKLKTSLGWSKLLGKGTVLAPGWRDDLTVPTFEQILDVVQRRGGAVITPELKVLSPAGDTDTKLAPPSLAAILRYGLQQSVIVQSFRLSALASFKAAGIAIAPLQTGATALATLQAASVDYFGYDYTNTGVFTPAYLQSLYDAGIKLFPYTMQRRTEYTAELARVGRPLALVASNDAMWMAGTNKVQLVDPFVDQLYTDGMIAFAGNRGIFRSGAKFGFDNAGAVQQGWGSALTAQTSITFTITMESVAADSTKGAYILFGCPDDSPGSVQNTGSNGYLCYVRQSGTVDLYKQVGTSLTRIGSTLATPALNTIGATAQIKVEFAASNNVKVTRIDGGGLTTTGVEATYRGGIFHFGNSCTDANVSFSAVTIV